MTSLKIQERKTTYLLLYALFGMFPIEKLDVHFCFSVEIIFEKRPRKGANTYTLGIKSGAFHMAGTWFNGPTG